MKKVSTHLRLGKRVKLIFEVQICLIELNTNQNFVKSKSRKLSRIKKIKKITLFVI